MLQHIELSTEFIIPRLDAGDFGHEHTQCKSSIARENLQKEVALHRKRLFQKVSSVWQLIKHLG
jgi:hypothetical protein